MSLLDPVANERLWTMPRPTRDLHDLHDSLKYFASIAKGKKWYGNKSLQIKFEAGNPAKTANAGKYGSGGRTWAALLKVYGLWYDDQSVTITSAGNVILSGKNMYEQIVHQIMNFQITSAYSVHQNMQDGFKIFPFRIILKMLLDLRIKYLEQEEIALFLLNMKTPTEYEKAVTNILYWRNEKKTDGKELKERESLIKKHMKVFRPEKRTDSPTDVKGHWRYINNDFANTFLNHIRFIHEIVYDQNKGEISIDNKDRPKIIDLLDKHEKEFKFSTLFSFGEKPFYEHYGLRFDRHKASSKSTKPKTREAKRLAKIKFAFETILKNNPKTELTKIARMIASSTGIRPDEVESTITSNPEDFDLTENSGLDPSFVDYYLECGKSGKDDATFEEMTRSMFSDLGLPTEKHKVPRKRGGGEIDGLILNPKTCKSGLLECKSTSSTYSLSIGDRDKMKNEYIGKFRKKVLDKKKYELDFFVYVVGNKFGGKSNFDDIVTDTGLNGSVILSQQLLNLYAMVKSGKITIEKFWEIFKKNKILSLTDFS